MKEIVIRLIEDEIRITRLVRTFAKINVDAYDYLLGSTRSIFELSQIDKCDMDSTELSDRYFSLIEKLADEKINVDKVQMRKATERVYNMLQEWY